MKGLGRRNDKEDAKRVLTLAGLGMPDSMVGNGHIIQSEDTPLAQRDNLNFVGFEVTDDEANNASVVENASLLTVQEQDGTPTAAAVTTIKVSNGTLTSLGGGVVSLLTGGDGVVAPGYSNIVVVDQGDGGDYTTLTAALAAITDASATNRYGVVVMPGIYDEFDIELKDCIDIMAYVPGTVLFKPTTAPSGYGIFSRMDGALATGVNVTGIEFDLGVGYAKYCLILSYAGALNATFRHCKFTVSSGVASLPAGVSYHTSGNVLFENCIFENNVSNTTMAALGCAPDGGTVVVSKCRLTVNSTASGSQVIDAEGSGLAVYHCELSGGEYSIAVQVSAATVYVALTRMTANIGPNVTNSIALPHNATNMARPTTSIGGATITYNSGQAVNISTTFDGYTIAQVVKALRDLGALT